MSTQNKSGSWLIFVDTNIFLDFYRLGGESAGRQIASLERHKDKLILCEQIKMEFLRNRQRVLLESLNKFEDPKIPSFPPIITEIRDSKSLAAAIRVAKAKHKSVKSKIENILSNPTRHDPVYQSINRLFDSNSIYNLKRPNKIRYEIRNLARKRFILGYPPRKQNDTSIGDAFNWEWIIKCAQISRDKDNVLIVTRDNDYGVTYGQNTYINDWLYREFKDRVSRKRKVELTNKLTIALKLLTEPVSIEDEKKEENIIAQRNPKQQHMISDSLIKKLLDDLYNATQMRYAIADAEIPINEEDDDIDPSDDINLNNQ